MIWLELNASSDIESILELSKQETIVFFKHSTRCSISSVALSRFKNGFSKLQHINGNLYFLDLLAYRDLSNKIALLLNIEHQSPQILLLKNRICVYHASHLEIDVNDLLSKINQN